MPGITRQSADVAGGTLTGGSRNVYANNLPVSRIGDSVAGHGRNVHAGPTMATGSGNVYTNNIRTCKAGDVATCGHSASGSGNVYVNG